ACPRKLLAVALMGSILTLLFGRPKLAPPKPEGSADPAASGTAAGASAAAADASALRENIQKKGENAYYYAHNRKFEVPADAKVISGPGLVTGGPPVKLDIEANAPSADKPLEAIRNFSWTDDGGKVKVYLQLPDGTLQDASQVTCDFQPHSFHVQVSQDKGAGGLVQRTREPRAKPRRRVVLEPSAPQGLLGAGWRWLIAVGSLSRA
ncbi:unnamed protein product, partial [Effrenium voratum]